ncbi:hypothetical protein KSP39_PZI009905 [Platanthera zijinensis]|uniref:Reverse transcriptase zinc-binding domain-containing protein n=1 Tax=Platanthera zijinensis TaxID=2320716 RepID=A0AAP0BJI3_9ASPA
MDVALILSILLGRGSLGDRWVWDYSNSGLFSVRSVYHLIHLSDRSSASGGLLGWNFIWKADVPPRIRVFLWRLASDILPTGVGLRLRHSAGLIACSFCGSPDEDARHALFTCPSVCAAWDSTGFGDLDSWWRAGSPECWVRGAHGALSREDFAFFATLCWALWWRQNRLVWEGVVQPMLLSVIFARAATTTFLESLGMMTAPRCVGVPCWLPPGASCVKLNFDGAVRKDPNRVGLGVVARDSWGVLNDLRADLVPHFGCPAVSEALAARLAVDLAVARG